MRWLGNLIFILMLWSQGTFAFSCSDTFKKLAGMVLDKTALIAVAAGGAWAGSEGVGQMNQTPLIGLSIYFDYENILSYLTQEERIILQARHKNPERIIEILNKYLSQRSGDNTDIWPYLNPLMASQYFSETPPQANMCRHKALILKTILNHLGIEAKLRTGTVDADSGRGEHVWVYVPSLKKVADPMNNVFVDEARYDELFHPSLNLGITHFAKPVGIMAR
ncbi:MAG: hypothetical protein EBQ92_09060 [Proteobacteria bacterium]|jgi:hypothetical protein|nr:hypothetical protein [Pseudomonadota bacterium]